jgi:hypothetical protein
LKLAYAAGLFDAEGSLQIVKGRSGKLEFTISCNNDVLLNAAQSIIQGTVYKYQRSKINSQGKKITFLEGRLDIHRVAQAELSLKAILPFLILKKPRAEIALKALAAHPHDRAPFREELQKLNAKQQREDYMLLADESLCDEYIQSLAETDFAYLAGMIDGDGWISYQYWKGYSGLPRVMVSSAKPSFLISLHRIYKGKLSVRDNGGVSQSCLLYMSMETTSGWRLFLQRLIPHLVLKRGHAELVLAHLNDSQPTEEKRELLQKTLCEMTAKARAEALVSSEDVVSASVPLAT